MNENDPMEPMLASTGTTITANSVGSTVGGGNGGFFARICSFITCGSSAKDKDTSIAPYQELIVSPKAYRRSLNCLRFAVFADAIAGTIEQPNYREYDTGTHHMQCHITNLLSYYYYYCIDTMQCHITNLISCYYYYMQCHTTTFSHNLFNRYYIIQHSWFYHVVAQALLTIASRLLHRLVSRLPHTSCP